MSVFNELLNQIQVSSNFSAYLKGPTAEYI